MGGAPGRKRNDAILLALELGLLLAVGLFLVGADRTFRSRTERATLSENRFLVTEWRLMRELKERTDRELGDKDREIAELRLRYLGLKAAGSPAELLDELEKALRQAELERNALFSSRLKAAVESTAGGAPPATAAAGPDAPGSGTGAASTDGLRSGAYPDTWLNQLLRARVGGLEAELAASRARAEAAARELADLRRDPAAAIGQARVAPEARPEGGTAAVAGPEAAPSGGVAEPVPDLRAFYLALEAGRAGLAEAGTVLGLSELRTRALLRAIVRSPAIRAEYPDLLEALDRYFELAGKDEYLRGRREAYDEIVGTLETLLRD